MAKLAVRVTSDKSKREHIVAGNSEIIVEFLTGNKKQKQIHMQMMSDGFVYLRTYGPQGLGGKCEQVIHLGYN